MIGVKPPSDGESLVIWEYDGERFRLQGEAGGWRLHAEGFECDEWEPRGVSLEGYRRMWLDLVSVFRAGTDSMTLELMKIMLKGKAEVPHRKPIKLAWARGWWVKWTCEGEGQDGDPFLTLEFKRPLCAEEMMCVVFKLTHAIDAWDKERS